MKKETISKLIIYSTYIITTLLLLGVLIKGIIWIFLGHPKFFWFEPLFFKVLL